MPQKLKIGVTEYLVLTDDDLLLLNKPYFFHGVHHHIEEAQPTWDEIDAWKGRILVITTRSLGADFMKSELWSKVIDNMNCFILKMNNNA